MNIVVIGAHPDDAEFFAGGTMTLLSRSGHRVVAVSLSNGDIGHHEMGGEMLAQRRYQEADDLVESISQQLAPGIASSELRRDLDPRDAARALLAYQNGLAMLWFTNPEAFSVKENAEALAKIYLHGIAG